MAEEVEEEVEVEGMIILIMEEEEGEGTGGRVMEVEEAVVGIGMAAAIIMGAGEVAVGHSIMGDAQIWRPMCGKGSLWIGVRDRRGVRGVICHCCVSLS